MHASLPRIWVAHLNYSLSIRIDFVYESFVNSLSLEKGGCCCCLPFFFHSKYGVFVKKHMASGVSSWSKLTFWLDTAMLQGSLSRSHERGLRASCPGVWKGFHGWNKCIEANESTSRPVHLSLMDNYLWEWSLRKLCCVRRLFVEFLPWNLLVSEYHWIFVQPPNKQIW